MKTMIKALVVIALMSQGLCAMDTTSTQGYDFVSQKLLYNKTNVEQAKPEARGCMGTLVRETAFVVPSVLAGYVTAFILSAAVASSGGNRGDHGISAFIGTLLGTIFVGPVASFGYYGVAKLIASYWNTKPVALPTLQEFVKNWNVYKNNVPVELHQEFDALYYNYLQNQGKLAIKEAQAKEILNRVLAFCADRSEAIQCTNGFAVRR